MGLPDRNGRGIVRVVGFTTLRPEGARPSASTKIARSMTPRGRPARLAAFPALGEGDARCTDESDPGQFQGSSHCP